MLLRGTPARRTSAWRRQRPASRETFARTFAKGRKREGDTNRGTPTEGRRRGGRRTGARDVRAGGVGAPHTCEGTNAGGGCRRRDVGEGDTTADTTAARGNPNCSCHHLFLPCSCLLTFGNVLAIFGKSKNISSFLKWPCKGLIRSSGIDVWGCRHDIFGLKECSQAFLLASSAHQC